MVIAAPTASRADEAEVKKEIAELKALIMSQRAEIGALKAAVGQQKVEVARTRVKIKSVADRVAAAPRAPSPEPVATGKYLPADGFEDRKIHMGSLVITPGGFIAAESVFRTRATQSGIISNFSAIPFPNVPYSHTNEFKTTAQQTRIALLAEGAITPTTLAAGYLETDFLGDGTASNFNQTYSFVPRIRNLYGTLDLNDYGFHFLAGQSWSLATLYSKGITPRNEVFPPTIDNQPMPGYVYNRQPQVRIVKNFGEKLWLGLSLESPQTTFANGCVNTVSNTGATIGTTTPLPIGAGQVSCLAQATGGGFAQTGETQQLSLNHVPDVIGKAAYEIIAGERDIHVEGFGMYRDFYDRVNYGTFGTNGYSNGSTNFDRTGYGFGGGIVAPVLPRHLDFEANGLVGRGIGRYTGSPINDATLAPNGSIQPLYGQSVNAGFIAHATPALDVYAFGGMDQIDASYAYNPTNGSYVGYGIPNANDSGCFIEGASSTACAGNTRRIWQLTGGLWDKMYKGSFGMVRVGFQYQYTQRDLFQSSNGPNGSSITPKTYDHAFLTSFRYYPFD